MHRLAPSSNTSKIQGLPKHGRATTPSFICEVPLLLVTSAQERQLWARLEAAWQLNNGLLAQALRRLRLLRQSNLYQAAKLEISAAPCQPNGHSPPGCGLHLSLAVAVCKQNPCIVDRRAVDAVGGQTLASPAFQAVNKTAVGHAKQVRRQARTAPNRQLGKRPVLAGATKPCAGAT